MIKKNVSIIDYKVGNHSSLEKIFRELKCSVQVTNKISILEKSDLIVLPGVGTFPVAMKQINKLELVDFLRDWTKKNKYLLGICLGMHLLCDKSSELTETNGIGIIPGEIVKMKNSNIHVGWNNVDLIKKNTIFSSFNNEFFYFNHSFIYKGSTKFQLATSDYKIKVPAIIRKKNSFGTQFHPEKSQIVGKKFLKSFMLDINNVS